ncbi:ATP-dependent DNA helicase [Tersicoccus sp. Bi-70]|uniref:ATP-dependent DNA helicase n=1 Tax=Tersicoccus sp. Bi-70 TaxID=1897634 RepID=UPI0009758A8B|nr:ATP-dependent DNA helicase [Tersicoccus sp. Bi-70]OMH31564.1 ATP-dependent helicase [Tersicoccus sp. Bi-70]
MSSTPAAPATALLDAAVAGLGGERRDGQRSMLEHVEAAITEKRHLLVQAGTGTGKSLAYLVPLIRHALDAERPVLVATATLALQSQIVGRDLPRLLDALAPELDRRIDVALVKGRGNYVCRHKLDGGFPAEEDAADTLFSLAADTTTPHPGAPRGDATRADSGPISALGREITRLRAWAEETETGDRDDLRPGVSERAWRQVSVSAMECIGAQKCPVAAECFSERARQRGAEADLVVTNHAMLAIDAFEGLAVLPDYEVAVIDEAHELADRVTGAVTGQLSSTMVHTAATAARRHTAIDVTALHEAADGFDAALATTPTGLLGRGLDDDASTAVNRVLAATRAALSDSKSGQGAPADGGRQMARSRLTQVHDVAERLLAAAPATDAVWVSRPGHWSPQTGYAEADPTDPATLTIAPLSVAGRLREGLFADRTVVLTSATLAVGAAFEPVAGALGLQGTGAPAWTGVDVGSPFDYPRQGVLYVAKHLPRPGPGISAGALEELEALIRASGGGTLGLFSARRAAEQAADALREKLDVPILCQGEGSTAALIDQFAADPDTCLFGTMSLWQGVDVPGPSCRLVVIDKIPFPRPDDALSTARTRAVAGAGGNGFMAVAASHAAVRLAQGAGRLIRSRGDRGVVAVLDSRLATAGYGGFLRASLPPFWSTTDRDVALAALRRLAAADAADAANRTEAASA